MDMAEHSKRRIPPPKGSTVIIAFMYATWCGYLALQVWCKSVTGSYLPAEVTYGTAALFIAETVSLARLKMAKEGTQVRPKKPNSFLSKVGVPGIEDFEDEVQQVQQSKTKEQ